MSLNDLLSAYQAPRKRHLLCVGKIVLLACSLFFYSSGIRAQSVTTFTIDFSNAKDTTVTISSNRNGNVCKGSNCIKFDITLNAGSDQLSLDVKKPAPPGASAFYQVNCGPQTSLATPVCISGLKTVSVTFCKTGNDAPDYTISASSLVKGSADLYLRQNCSGTISVTGLQASSVIWNSIYPGTSGQYNSYLSCQSGCISTTVTPQSGSPAYIDYRVSGATTSCSNTKADTIRVYASAGLTVPVAPANPAICSGASVTLSATPSGGNPPYTYAWSSGQTTSSIIVNTIGTYSVTVSDNTIGCMPVTTSTTVTQASTPVAPTASGTSICAGNTATLTATAPGGTYGWYDAASGGNLLFTGAVYTTPILNSNTTYYVQTTVSSCSSSRTAVTVNVTTAPAAPTASSATICSGSTASLLATAPGGTYQWYDAVSGGNLLSTGAIYNTPVLNGSTSYYVQTTVSGCAGNRTAVPVTVTSLPSAPVAGNASICSGTGTSLTATSPGGNYQWFDAASGGNLLSTGAIYNTPVLNGSTSYYVQTTLSGCTSSNRTTVSVTVNTIPPAPTASAPAVCAGNTALATATSPASGVTYLWYDAPSAGNLLTTGTTYTTPVLNSNTNYYVQTSLSGCSSSRTTVTITVNAAPSAPSAQPVFICYGNTAVLTATSPGGIYQWYDAASGGNLLSTGVIYNTPVLNGSTSYYVQTTVSGCAGNRTAVPVTVTPLPSAPVAGNASICSGTGTSLTATSPGGNYQWFDAASGGNLLSTGAIYTTPVLNGSASYYVQTTLSGCTSSNRTTVSVTVNTIPPAPTASAPAVCAGNTALATATSPASGVTYLWYDAPSAGNLLTTGTTYTTPVLNSNTNYYVQTSLSGCSSSRTTVTITVNAAPSAPSAQPVFICYGNTAVLTATSPGGIYQWYDAASGGNLLSTGVIYNTPVLTATTQFYVQTTISGCPGSRTAVTANVNPAPATPTVLGNSICAGNSTSLTATAPGGTYQWFDAASGGNLLYTGTGFITPILNNTSSYYVQSTIAGCTGPRAAVTVTVIPTPAAPTAAGVSVCAGSATNLMASAPGGTYQWYDAASGGNLLFTGSVYATSALNNTTAYYVQTTVGTCTGQRTGVTVTVNPIPAAPVSAGGSTCPGNALTLSASGSTGVYQWYDSTRSGILLATGSSFTTPVLNNTKQYYVQATSSGCTSSRTAVNAVVFPIQQPAFNYASGTFCKNGANATPVIAGGISGTFSSSPAGLVFVSTGTGEINIAASSLGTYTIQFTTNGPCVYSSSTKITITNSPNAAFLYNGPYCPQQSAAVPDFVPGASAGVFSTGSSGLVFSNSSSGAINLQKSTPGTYTITNNIAAAGGCIATSASGTVTILVSPVVIAGSNQAICAGNAVTLNGSIGGTATQGTWSGGAGSFTDPSQLITQYKPANNESIVKLYLTTDDPSGPCTAVTDSLIVFINPLPSAPQVQNISVCKGTIATLIATSPGGIYEWYSSSSGGTLISTGSSFTSPVLLASSTYYVQSTLNGCTGPRSPATIQVSEKPLIVSPANSEVCSANPFTYLIVSNQPGTVYTWARSSVTGINNPSSSGQTDSTITEVLNNTTGKPVPATYSIIPVSNGCAGDPFFFTTSVKPTPAAPVIGNSTPVCAGTPLNLFTNNITSATYQWSGPNGFSSAQQNPVIANITTASAGMYKLVVTLNNCASSPSAKNIAPVIAAPVAASNSPVCEQNTLQLTAGGLPGATYSWAGPSGFSSSAQNPSLSFAMSRNAGVYYVTASIAGCTGLTDSVAVTVNIQPTTPQVSSNSPVCSSDSITLKVLNASSNANFLWSGPGGFSSTSSSPLISVAKKTDEGAYNLTESIPGCAITSAAIVTVSVNQKPDITSIGNNGPRCEGDTLFLNATSLPGAAFSWRSESGYRSLLQNPVLYNITKANEETYRVVATLKGCSSDTAITKISVIKPSIANAGNNGTVCANNAPVTLSGSITGEDTQAGTWSSDGSGLFLPDKNQLSATYIPDQKDTSKRKVTLTLKTINNKVCPVSTSSITINIAPAPKVNAGPDNFVCSNDSLINLVGEIVNADGGIWSGSGSGFFQRSGSSLAKVYVVSRQDIQKGSVSFYLVSTGNGSCLAVRDTVTYSILPIPFVDAGNDLTIFENETVRLTPFVKGDGLQFLWTPSLNLNSDTARSPLLTGKNNQEYRVRVTGTGSCSVEDKVFIRVLKPFIIPNIFTPNGDGIYDSWAIPELANYPGAAVEIFTRTGQKIYSSVGYDRPWDGTFNGKPLPVATYYYIIKPNFRNLVFSGSVTIVR